jgi:hypothetical protein
MDIGGQDHRFWIAIIGAAAFKVWTSKERHKSVWGAAATGAFALFCPYIFTDPLLSIMGWGEGYKIIVAALLTLTGEGIMRWMVNLTPDKAIAMWKEFKK